MEQENPSGAARVRRTSAVSSAILHETFEVNFFAVSVPFNRKKG